MSAEDVFKTKFGYVPETVINEDDDVRDTT